MYCPLTGTSDMVFMKSNTNQKLELTIKIGLKFTLRMKFEFEVFKKCPLLLTNGLYY